MLARGNLTAGGVFNMSGTLNLEATFTNGFSMLLEANVSLSLSVNGTSVFTFSASGALDINSSGVVAYIQVTRSAGANLGFSFGGGTSFDLGLNTTGSAVTLNPGTGNVTVNPGFEVSITGSMTFPGLSLNGTFLLEINSGSLQIHVNANVNIIGVQFSVIGFVGIYYDSSPGIAFSLQLSIGGNNRPSIQLIPGVDIGGTFTLQVNTTRTTRNGIASGLVVSLSNLDLYLFGFNLSGSLTIGISTGGFYIIIPASDPLSMNFLGIVTLSVSGYLFVPVAGGGTFTVPANTFPLQFAPESLHITSILFSFTASAGFSFGDSWFGLSASISVTINNGGFSATIGGSITIVGISFSASATVSVENGDISVGFSIRIPVFWVPFHTVYAHYSHTFDFGHVAAPPAGAIQAQTTPPPLAGFVSSGVLELYIGQDVGNRTGDTTPQNPENYSLTLISGSGASENINVTALGYTEEYDGVSSILVNNIQKSGVTGGNNTITIASGISVPVTMTLGGDSTTVNTITTGSGLATITITGGQDTVTTGNNASIAITGGTGSVTTGDSSTITVSGDGNNTITTGNSSTVIISAGTDTESNTVTAGSSANITIGGAANNNVSTGNSPTISITGSGDNNVDTSGGNSPASSDTVTISGGGDNDISSNGNITAHISGGGNNSVSGHNTANVTITGGGDNFIITGNAFATVTDEGTGSNFVIGGTGGGVYIGGVNSGGTAFSSNPGKEASDVVSSYNNFQVDLSGYSSYTLTNGSVQYGNYLLTIQGVNSTVLTTLANSANTITLSGGPVRRR